MRTDTDAIKALKKAHADRLILDHGPAPVNIFTTLRNQLDWTLEYAAAQMFISKQSLIRLEQGTFDKPLPTVVDFWTRYPFLDRQISAYYLEDGYDYFQMQMRRRNINYFGDLVGTWDVSKGTRHPLERLRGPNAMREFSVSITEVAKALCVPQASLQVWEAKWRTQQSVPKAFLEALNQVGYARKFGEALNTLYQYWRENNLDRPCRIQHIAILDTVIHSYGEYSNEHYVDSSKVYR